VIQVGNVGTVTVDLSKDNVSFGIRAVDTAGRRSPVASPQPAEAETGRTAVLSGVPASAALMS
jgi:hypothetical protein